MCQPQKPVPAMPPENAPQILPRTSSAVPSRPGKMSDDQFKNWLCCFSLSTQITKSIAMPIIYSPRKSLRQVRALCHVLMQTASTLKTSSPNGYTRTMLQEHAKKRERCPRTSMPTDGRCIHSRRNTSWTGFQKMVRRCIITSFGHDALAQSLKYGPE